MIIIFMMVLVIIVLFSTTLGLTKLKIYNDYLNDEIEERDKKIDILEANQIELNQIVHRLTDTKNYDTK